MIKNLKHILLISATIVGGCQTVQVQNSVQPVSLLKVEPLINATEVVAVVNTQLNSVDLEQKASEWGYSLKRKEKLTGLDMYIMTFDCPPGINPYDAVVELEKLQDDSTISVNHKYSLNSGKSVIASSTRHYADELIHWPEAGCEAQMVVGIIDGGISDELLNKYKDQITYKSFINGPPSQPAMNHGDAIASILIEPNRLNQGQFYIASVVSEDDMGQQFSGIYSMLKALDWMIQSEVKLVNVSLAGPKNKTLGKAIKRASEKGMIIVAAVGNDGKNAQPRYPAAFDEVIAATAVNRDGQIYGSAVRGDHVDFAAPGVKVYVPSAGAGKYVSGTSIAAPFVTAMIASHTQNSANLSSQDVVKRLTSSTIDLGPNGKDPTYGLGLIRAQDNCTL